MSVSSYIIGNPLTPPEGEGGPRASKVPYAPNTNNHPPTIIIKMMLIVIANMDIRITD